MLLGTATPRPMLGLKSVLLGSAFLIGYVTYYGADLPSFELARSQAFLGVAGVLTGLGLIGGQMLGLKLVIVGAALLTGYVGHYGADLSFFWLTRSQLFLSVAAIMIIYGVIRPD